MSTKISDYWTNVLLGSAIEDHSVYHLSELDLIPNKPGIYAWYLIADKANVSDYFRIFKQKKIKINIEGHLKEMYYGEAKSIYFDDDFHSPTMDHDLCKVASLAFSPPLYIGISKHLKDRLKTHSNELEKIFYGKVPLSAPATLGKTDFDTIVESTHFAQRIGFTMNTHKSITLNSLLIRTLEMPDGYIWQDLQKVEKYLNRTYVPVYGRK